MLPASFLERFQPPEKEIITTPVIFTPYCRITGARVTKAGSYRAIKAGKADCVSTRLGPVVGDVFFEHVNIHSGLTYKAIREINRGARELIAELKAETGKEPESLPIERLERIRKEAERL